MEKCCTVSLSLDIMAKDFFFGTKKLKNLVRTMVSVITMERGGD